MNTGLVIHGQACREDISAISAIVACEAVTVGDAPKRTRKEGGYRVTADDLR